MWSTLFASLVGIITGSAAFFISTYWMQPILKYREIRQQVLSDLVYFANAISSETTGDAWQPRVIERMNANRKSAANLEACLFLIPAWYLRWIKSSGQDPHTAVSQLIGLSNDQDFSSSDRRIGIIKSNLGIQP
jgi:hypothetical protein